MRYFCTYFDHSYLARGLALYESLRRHCPAFRLWVLGLDAVAVETLRRLALPDLEVMTLADLERHDPALAAVKPTRSRFEYYFTCTPALPLAVLERQPAVDLINYLDSDLWFHADPAPLFTELGGGSVAIIPHRFPPRLRQRERNGLYNVGWLSFRRDANGLACLRWYRERCLEWCYDRFEAGRYADQKYLEEWPQRFPGVVVLAHPGANLAPWNLDNHELRCDGRQVLVDDRPLLFFHYQGLKALTTWLYDTNLVGYATRSTALVRRHIYEPYLRALHAAARQTGDEQRASGPRSRGPRSARQQLREALKTLVRAGRGVRGRNYLLFLNQRVY